MTVDTGAWFTAADVAAVGRVPVPTVRHEQIAAAVAAFVERIRWDLRGLDGIYTPTPDVAEAARLFAELALRSGAVAQLDDMSVAADDYGKRQQAYMLLGNPGPVIA